MHKYMRLCSELEASMKSGLFKQGTRLPSVRTLAEQHECSMSTILAALKELERRHLVYSVPKSGYYVVQTPPSRTDGHRIPIDFSAAAPDPDIFPYRDFQHCINKAIDIYKNDLFIYGTARGLPTLLSTLQKQLADYQVFAQERNIVITSGVQQALSVLSGIPFPSGKKTVLIEQPGYHLFIQHLLTHQIPVQGIQRTAAGVDLDELEGRFRTGDIKFFYTTPRAHAPLGTSYTNQEKKQMVELARKYDVYLVEDDYMADLEQDSRADPMFAFDRDQRVIYLKSYSKIIFPGLRVGAAVLPEPLVDVFTHYKRTLDIDSSMLSQGALEIYLKSGMFEHHRERIRESYTKRAKQLAETLMKEMSTSGEAFEYSRSSASYPGIHTHVVLNERISILRIIQRMKKHHILLGTMDSHYLPGYPQDNILKLNATTVREEDIRSGISQLAAELRLEMNTH